MCVPSSGFKLHGTKVLCFLLIRLISLQMEGVIRQKGRCTGVISKLITLNGCAEKIQKFLIFMFLGSCRIQTEAAVVQSNGSLAANILAVNVTSSAFSPQPFSSHHQRHRLPATGPLGSLGASLSSALVVPI